MRTKADKGEGDFSANGRPHFTQHVGQEDSVTTLACKLCIQYIAQGISAGIRRPARPPTRFCSVCCCSTLPSLNYPRQLALMAAMTTCNSYLVLHARPMGQRHGISVISSLRHQLCGRPHRRRGIWPDVDKSRQGGGRVDFCHIFADVLYG